jgi:hypothetical protein
MLMRFAVGLGLRLGLRDGTLLGLRDGTLEREQQNQKDERPSVCARHQKPPFPRATTVSRRLHLTLILPSLVERPASIFLARYAAGELQV